MTVHGGIDKILNQVINSDIDNACIVLTKILCSTCRYGTNELCTKKFIKNITVIILQSIRLDLYIVLQSLYI